MATQRFLGVAAPVAQVVNLTPAAVEIGDTFTVRVGDSTNGRTVVYTAANATVADVVNGLVALLSASVFPEFQEIGWTAGPSSAYIIGTAQSPGVPFTATLARTQSAQLSAPSGLNAVPTVSGSGTLSGTFFYKITAITALGETSPSAEVTSAAGNGGVLLGWAASTGATAYKIYRGTTTGTETFLVQIPPGTAYTDYGVPLQTSTATPPTVNTAAIPVPTLTSATSDTGGGSIGVGTYFYKITAITAIGETTASNEHQATLAGTGEIVLVWPAVTGSTGFKVYRGTVTNTQNKLVATLGVVTTYTDTTAAPSTGFPPTDNGACLPVVGSPTATTAASANGALVSTTEYFYQLTATNAAGETTGSTEVKVYATATGTILLSWSAVTGATGYNLYRSTTTTTEVFIQALGNVTSYLDFGTIAATAATVPVSNTTASASTFTLTTPTANTGPNNWDAATNWSTGSVPITGDAVILDNLATNISYGLNQTGVALVSLTRTASFTGQIGLPDTNVNGYTEYRKKQLQIGLESTFLVTLGNGIGSHPSLERYDFDGTEALITIYGTGSSAQQGQETCLISDTGASSVLNIYAGSVGVAVDVGSTATLATLRIGYQQTVSADVAVRCGSGLTVTTVKQSGGTLTLNGACTTLTKTSGTTFLIGSGAVTTVNANGNGTLFVQTTGTIGTLNLGTGALADFTHDMSTHTVSACTMYAGSGLIDSYATLQAGFAVTLSGCRIGDLAVFDLGLGQTLTRT